MTITLIILAYIASVFLNRWLNYLIIRLDLMDDKFVLCWFVPYFTTFFFIFVLIIGVIIEICNTKFNNWFTGKHW